MLLSYSLIHDSWIELATFGSEVKCLTHRPSWICKNRCFLDSSKYAARPGKNENLQNWCGNILSLVWKFSSLVWKFFVSCADIFRFQSYPTIGAKNFHTRAEKFTHQRQKKFTRDNKYLHQKPKMSKPETKYFQNRTEKLEEKYLL